MFVVPIYFPFFPLVFVLVNDLLLSGFSLFLLFLVCFGNAYDFVFVLFLFVVCICIYCRV